jgi:hypothetical protein
MVLLGVESSLPALSRELPQLSHLSFLFRKKRQPHVWLVLYYVVFMYIYIHIYSAGSRCVFFWGGKSGNDSFKKERQEDLFTKPLKSFLTDLITLCYPWHRAL